MSAYPVTAESPVSTHPGTQQTLNKMCAREKKRYPHFTAKETEAPPKKKKLRPKSHLPKVTELLSGGLGTKVEELHLSRKFLPPTQGVKVTPSQNHH